MVKESVNLNWLANETYRQAVGAMYIIFMSDQIGISVVLPVTYRIFESVVPGNLDDHKV